MLQHYFFAAWIPPAGERTAFATQVVADVDAFPGHIPCDSASRSEIVVAMVAADGALIGVWDVDSPELARFDHDDRAGMEALVQVYLEALRE